MSAVLAEILTQDPDRPQAPILSAVIRGEISLSASDSPDDRITNATLSRRAGPSLFATCANCGPGRVRHAKVVRTWCRLAILHAAEERAEDYIQVVECTRTYRSVWLIETTAPLAATWLAFLREGPRDMAIVEVRPQ